MATLTRQTQKVFAGSANADQIAIMGTMKTGTPQYSTSLANLQSAAYQQGWADAILNDKAPYLEEMNGVQYGFSYQLAYLLQEGLPEYDANTAYGLTSIVKVISGNELMLYHPIQLDANGECKGHALSETAWWARLYFTSTTAIGNPQITLNNTLPPSCIWLDGSAVSRTTYASLFAIYGITYGSGDGSTTFNLPDFRNRAIWGSSEFGYIAAGLPNITAAWAVDNSDWISGAAYVSGSNNHGASGSSGYQRQAIFNASRSSSIYGKSSTVQPPAIKVRVYTRYE